MSDESKQEEPEIVEESAGPAERTSRGESWSEEGKGVDDWELWAKIAVLMAGTTAAAWMVVLLRLGEISVYTHAFILSTLGVLTLPIILWGMAKTMFNRPVFRKSRTIAFALLLAVATFGNVPLFSVPLSTEDWKSEHVYRLPFEGEWAVTAGGGSTDVNYHATTATYRWAYDFTPVKDGERHSGDGDELSDYYCYGEPVLAPQGGEVIDVEGDKRDNEPGEFDAESVLGNRVVIEVDEGEYLFVAHMKQDSVIIEKGDTVEQGDKLGECGNSGRSLYPHVHVHLQNTKDFPMSESLPLVFSDYFSNGEPVDKGMPKGSSDPEKPFGEIVKPQ